MKIVKKSLGLILILFIDNYRGRNVSSDLCLVCYSGCATPQQFIGISDSTCRCPLGLTRFIGVEK